MIPALNKWLSGKPEIILNILLIAIAGVAIGVALVGNPAFKGIVAAWFLFP